MARYKELLRATNSTGGTLHILQIVGEDMLPYVTCNDWDGANKFNWYANRSATYEIALENFEEKAKNGRFIARIRKEVRL